MMTTLKFIRSSKGETSVYVAGQAPLFKKGEAVTYQGNTCQISHVISNGAFGYHYYALGLGVYVDTEDLLAENPRPMAAATLVKLLEENGVNMDELIAAHVGREGAVV